MRKIKPRIRVQELNDCGVTYYVANLRIGSYTLAVEETTVELAIFKAYLYLHNKHQIRTWHHDRDFERIPVLRLWCEQEDKAEEIWSEKLEQKFRLEQAALEAEVVIQRTLETENTGLPAGYESRMDEIPDHCLATSNLPWWKRLFRV